VTNEEEQMLGRYIESYGFGWYVLEYDYLPMTDHANKHDLLYPPSIVGMILLFLGGMLFNAAL